MSSSAPKPLVHRKNPTVLLMAFISKDLMMGGEGSAGGLEAEGSCSAGFVSGDSSSTESDLLLCLN